MLCDTCHQLLQTDLSGRLDCFGYIIPDSDGSVSFTSYADASCLFRGVADACYICSTRWDSLDADDQTIYHTYPSDFLLTRYTLSFEANHDEEGDFHQYVTLLVYFEGAEYQFKDIVHEFHLSPWYAQEILEDLPSNTGSKISQQLISSWISRCCTEHSICSRVSGEKTFRPTRILSLTPSGDGPGSCRLLVTKESPWIGPYVTLSHRWGSGRFLQLTTRDFVAFQQSIPLESMPMVFRDTIEVARALSINYLWIDSLCIFQDDDALEDWQNEFPNMEKVYANSFCNISAAGKWTSSDLGGGLFIDRNVKVAQPCLVFPNFKVLPEGYESWTPDTKLKLELKEEAIENSVLNSRAWTAQERLLAPRSIFFAKNQIFWECSKSSACEIYPNFSQLGYLHFKNSHPLIAEMHGFENDMITKWNYILREYSRRQLTYGRDRLPAISAIAKIFMKYIKSRYLAGLWEDHLIEQMLWVADHDASQSKSLDPSLTCKFQSPSWSWSSIRGGIFPLGVSHHVKGEVLFLATVKHASTNPVAADATGQVRSGSIILDAPLALVKSLLLAKDNWDESIKDCISPEWGHEIPQKMGGEDRTFIVTDDPHDALESKQDDVFALPLMVHYAFLPYVQGLLLRRSAARQDAYVRCGFFLGNMIRVDSDAQREVFGVTWDAISKDVVFNNDYAYSRTLVEII